MKKTIRIVIFAVIFLALIVGYYYYLTHRSTKTPEQEVKITELDEVLSKQLDTSYPATPREVVKFYNRILECVYANDYTQEQFDGLASQARKLMDEELLAGNPEEEYKTQLKTEVAQFSDGSEKILQTSVSDSDEVEYTELEGRECAYVEASYFMRKGKSEFNKTYERYLLRKDNDGNWKILAYYLINDEQ